jgi:hypothetical protein
MERPGEVEITRSQLVLRACGLRKGFTRVYVMGYGMSTHGFYPCLGLFVKVYIGRNVM